MELHELITELEKIDKNKTVADGFGSGMSWRGNYCEAAFEPVAETTIGLMLEQAKALLGSTQTGYKGGEFEMHQYVDVHIAEYGCIGEPINSFNIRHWST
jgi:hypothetical protein